MSIEAYEVYYSTGGKTDRAVVLISENESIEEALEMKDTDYSIDSRWCRITSRKKILLSSVKLRDLSVGELLLLLKS